MLWRASQKQQAASKAKTIKALTDKFFTLESIKFLIAMVSLMFVLVRLNHYSAQYFNCTISPGKRMYCLLLLSKICGC